MPQLFSHVAQARQRARFDQRGFIPQLLIEELRERMDMLRDPPRRVLTLGWRVTEHDAGQVVADRLEAPSGDYDAILAAGVLDTCEDVPGLLIQARRLLRPDGVLFAAFVGAPSFVNARRLLLAAEGKGVLRTHPLIDASAGAALLQRTGYALPVTDQHSIMVRYRSPLTLAQDLADAGLRSALAQRQTLPRRVAAQIAADWPASLEDAVTIVTLTGWRPG